MRTNILDLPQRLLNTRRWFVALLAALVVALGLATTAQAAQPPQAACTYSTPTTLHCELWARAGTFTPTGGSPLTVWGYTDALAGVITMPGGPTIVANEGDTVEVVLHNDLSGQVTSLALHGQGLRADTVGVAYSLDNSAAPYTFVASHPGTFLYEAGLTSNGAKQVAMGLYGVLIVQPTVAPATYTSETVLLLSEIDPALNADPTGFDMLEYAPKFWLINGEAYPDTDPIQVPMGSTLLVRYVNAGLTEHSMGLLGLDQLVIAKDGYARPAFRAVSETLAPGQTMDTLVTMLGAGGARYPLYDTSRRLDNNGAANGGMMTFVEVTNAAPTVSISAPADSSASAAGDSVTFTGVGSDAEDGDVTATLVWTSDLDGSLGTGATFPTALLSAGTHVITAVATDSGLLTGSASITITVNAPVAVDDLGYSMNALDGSLIVAAPGVLTNDSNLSLSSTVAVVTGPTMGTLTLNADGSFTYTYTGAPGTDSFTYQITSGASTSNIATVTITIN